MASIHIHPVKTESATIVVPDDYSTIQAAIDNANPGDTVYVRTGTYHENVDVDKSLLLIGENRSTTIIDGLGIESVVDIFSDNVTITGFTIRNCGIAHPEGCVRIASHNNNISFNMITNTPEFAKYGFYGIHLEYGQNNFIVGNDISQQRVGAVIPGVNNALVNNTFSDNFWGMVYAASSNCTFTNNTISDNEVYGLWMMDCTFNKLRDNKLANNGYNFGVTGNQIMHFSHDVDTSNLVNGNYIYYLIDQHDFTIDPTTYPGVGFLGLINSTGITIRDLILEKNVEGLLMANTNESIIESVNTSYNEYGIYLYHCWNNSIYHNNFIDNTEQAYSSESLNTWDGGYPSGGNYWSDYIGVDVFSGVNQNESGSDGIGDNPYVIYGVHQDNYPLMNPYGSLPWDVTSDGYVGIDDIVEVASHFGQSTAHPDWDSKCDITGDKYIGIDDIVSVAEHFGESI